MSGCGCRMAAEIWTGTEWFRKVIHCPRHASVDALERKVARYKVAMERAREKNDALELELENSRQLVKSLYKAEWEMIGRKEDLWCRVNELERQVRVLREALEAHSDPCGGQGWFEGPPVQVNEEEWVQEQVECQHCAALAETEPKGDA